MKFSEGNEPHANSHSSSSATDIRQFARASRLKWRLDECDDPIIPGKHGEIGEHCDDRLNVHESNPLTHMTMA